MEVTVNGEVRSVEEGTSVTELLATLGLASRYGAVEINREVVPRSEHGERRLAEGDVVEIIRFVGGG